MPTLPFPPGSLLVTYLRDSGGDEQDLSIDQQENFIRTWCEQNGYVLNQIFRDTRSGTSTIGRTGFEALIKYFLHKKSPPEAGLVLWRYNRFARDLDDAMFFKAGLRRRGYIIHSLNDPVPEGSTGKVIEFLIDWAAEKYSEDMSVEIKRGQQHLFMQYGAVGGFPPKGFKREPINLGLHRDGTPHIVHKWVPDPEIWETCRLAWKLRAAGASYRKIHEKTALFGSINSYSTFYTNRLYRGELTYGGQTRTDYAEPLIDQETWDAVQAINARHARNMGADNPQNARRQRSSFLLSGLLYCGLCEALMNGEAVKFKTETKTAAITPARTNVPNGTAPPPASNATN